MENCGLCWKCQSLLNTQYPKDLVIDNTDEYGDVTDKRIVRILKTRESVEITASNGCLLCLHILHALGIPARNALHQLTSVNDEASPHDIVYEMDIFIGDERDPPSIGLYVDPDNLDLGWNPGSEIRCSLKLYPEAEFPEMTPYANHGEVNASTGSDTSLSLAAAWLEKCSNDHESCNRSTSVTAFLPSRVIDLGSGEPRLIVVDENTPLLPFATMSHCWGSNAPLLLLSSKIAEFQTQIPTSELSKSFQDAFIVTRRLGLRYIWIDSLCIIQDSAEDWEKESQSMAEVYSHSHCNIAAAHATDGTQGCFIERNPDLVKPLKVELNWGPNPGTYYALPWRYWTHNVMAMPLHRRAWVCQERYLAPRNLYFGETQIYWECCRRIGSETFPLGVPGRVAGSSKDLDPRTNGAIRRKSMGLSETPELDTFSTWDLIVSTYSQGKLTYSRDKLVALSGLAARLQKHTNSKYLAGMWRKHLAYQLLWNVGGIQWIVSKSRPEIYTAPSWSWASTHGHIEDACVIRHADDREIIMEILAAEVELANEKNPFGQVKGGSLRLRCSLAKAGVHLEEEPMSRGSFNLFINGVRGGSASLDHYNHATAQPVKQYGLHYLPIRYTATYETITQNGVTMSVPWISGLIVQATSSITQSEFLRIGTFEIFYLPESFQAACRQYSSEVGQVKTEYGMDQWGAKFDIVII
ncbi:heterokaryon incompatibility protein [Glarea lozoyensis ATCC 20868]|uniref:Heterokaryon incompatibility protein n=1 Tax=Glarea lozoyensis (strain ATCC 20868 / MF5171) TaxID=1116229 RepID=S3CJ45_GLAL2|nr:heterokaryon incompatibility protein [Glarea lozoyensis ATCC 20868]EPE26537.1 heterokaryon incompatibility protein [Glarea lozoyensis ATCC 20868]